MKALLVLRPDAGARPDGDLVHAERAGAAVRQFGVQVDVVASDAPDARGYDLAHVFGVFEPDVARRQLEALRVQSVPIVLSPIWLDLRAYAASEVEAYLYGERLGLTAMPFVVAPLGVDDDAFDIQRPAQRNGVLCAGRVESKKNQAALLYALRDVDVDVTIVGTAYDPVYLALCKRYATPRTRFVDHAPRERVLAMMARAAVHAHPSWLESPGLSSLEAAATGTRIVAGDRGCEREYFGSDVDYADPAEPATIRRAVLRAFERGERERGDALERRLGSRTWQRHGEATVDAYYRAVVHRRR